MLYGIGRQLFATAFAITAILATGTTLSSRGQTGVPAAIERGSQTAKAGFKNEDEIRDKFNNWKADADARAWLAAMKCDVAEIESVRAAKPHGEKADVVVRIRLNSSTGSPKTELQQRLKDAKEVNGKIDERIEGISIKLVSSPNGFNQIDKRWLAHYAKMWKMPPDVVNALKLFLGEMAPNGPSRDPRRMFLDELEPAQKKALIEFFTVNKSMIVSDLIQGDGVDAAGWVMVAFKATDKPRWVIRSSAETMRFYSEGKVEMTTAGNLKIGRITMQRKGGDGGRETAKMLQFKINPALLLDVDKK